jgi:hypothetical protein
MDTKYIECITDFLGKGDDRYFSNGYKQFDFEFENLTWQEKILEGSVVCEYNWDKKRSKHLHLGTVEYIALAATICEQILEIEFNLSPEEIASSWISCFKMKIQACIDLTENKRISISGKRISLLKAEHSVNNYKSTFEVRINTTVIKIEITHPIYVWFNVSFLSYDCINASTMFCTAYKKRNHLINNIILNEAQMSCTADVSIEDYSSQPSGLGSHYGGTMLTDIILISGQLVQALFYTLENIDRNKANNLLLKEFEVSIKQPDSRMDYDAKVTFEDVKILKKGDETWKSVQFKSELGDITSKIKMVSQINNYNN